MRIHSEYIWGRQKFLRKDTKDTNHKRKLINWIQLKILHSERYPKNETTSHRLEENIHSTHI